MEGDQSIRLATRALTSGIYELKIDGYVDFSSSEQVEQAVDEIFSKGVYKIVVNLADTKYISSAGFGCFISSIDKAAAHDGDLIFSGTPRDIKEIFEILGLAKILQFADTPEEAARLFAAPRKAS